MGLPGPGTVSCFSEPFSTRPHQLMGSTMFSKKRNPPVDPEVRRRRRKIFWSKVGRRLLWFVAISFLLHSGLNIYASLCLNRELAKIRERGHPLSLGDLRPPAIPAGQNAADVYEKAFQAISLSAAEQVQISSHPSQNQQARDVGQINLRKIFLRNQQAMELARSASRMLRCNFPVNWEADDPAALNFPHFRKVRELGRLMTAHAVFQARNGNQEAALRDVVCVLRMAQHLSGEQTFIGFLVAASLESIGERGLADILAEGAITSEQAHRFEASIPNPDWESAFHKALLAERAWEITSFQILLRPNMGLISTMSGGESSVPRWLWLPIGLFWAPILKLDEIQTLRIWEYQINDPVFRQVPSPPGLAAEMDKRYQSIPQWAFFTRMLLPVFGRAAENRDYLYLRRAQREVALALAVEKTRTGNYPASLRELPPMMSRKLPLDLYSGHPFHYQRRKNWFLLYSVGPNRKDDGGQGPRGLPSKDRRHDDIAWGDVRRDENSD